GRGGRPRVPPRTTLVESPPRRSLRGCGGALQLLLQLQVLLENVLEQGPVLLLVALLARRLRLLVAWAQLERSGQLLDLAGVAREEGRLLDRVRGVRPLRLGRGGWHGDDHRLHGP